MITEEKVEENVPYNKTAIFNSLNLNFLEVARGCSNSKRSSRELIETILFSFPSGYLFLLCFGVFMHCVDVVSWLILP